MGSTPILFDFVMLLFHRFVFFFVLFLFSLAHTSLKEGCVWMTDSETGDRWRLSSRQGTKNGGDWLGWHGGWEEGNREIGIG